jgi:glycogen debranching enzyme
VQWTGDLDTARKYWPNVERALAYLDKEAAETHYLTYGKKAGALSNQGWKDSSDSIMYYDGTLAKPPIALIEVQAYLFDAWKRTAHLANLLDHKELAQSLTAKAQDLQTRFQKDYWMPNRSYACIALDGDNKQCNVSSSNPGHALVTGIFTDNQNVMVADKLNNPEMFSGFGVRTLSAFEKAYNPLSYHDGSIWPHDNAMIVEGLCAVGRKKEAGIISSGILTVGCNQHDYRLPELFCGLAKTYSDRPVWYPVSCSPQAWAAGSMFLMLDSLLGLKADALNHTLHVVNPVLPPYLDRLTMKNIRVADSAADLKFTREGDKTKCEVLRKGDNLQVVVE